MTATVGIAEDGWHKCVRCGHSAGKHSNNRCQHMDPWDGSGKPPPYVYCHCRKFKIRKVVPPAGAKVYVAAYKRPFTVRAANERYAVCTRPHFNTVHYFVLDGHRAVRGTENLVFGFGAETDEQCQEMLARLVAGESEVSYRNVVDWDVTKVVT